MDAINLYYDKEGLLADCYRDSHTTRQLLQTIICEVFAPTLTEKLHQILESKPFIFFIDGWSDSKQSHLTICIRFWNKNKSCIESRLFDDVNYVDSGTGKLQYDLLNRYLLSKFGQRAL